MHSKGAQDTQTEIHREERAYWAGAGRRKVLPEVWPRYLHSKNLGSVKAHRVEAYDVQCICGSTCFLIWFGFNLLDNWPNTVGAEPFWNTLKEEVFPSRKCLLHCHMLTFVQDMLWNPKWWSDIVARQHKACLSHRCIVFPLLVWFDATYTGCTGRPPRVDSVFDCFRRVYCFFFYVFDLWTTLKTNSPLGSIKKHIDLNLTL